jgi:glucose-6-phosphate isomerase
MSYFKDLPSYKRLVELAKNPFDLIAKGGLTPARIKEFYAKGGGFTFLYGTERVDKDVLAALHDLARQSDALEKMKGMQAGGVVNRIEGYSSENRKVLHTATRDFFDSRNESPAAKEASAIAYREVDKLKGFLPKVEGEFDDLIMIGIGGSDLGPRANYLALQYLKQKGRNVHFISNVDPDDAAQVLAEVNPEKCLVGVVSKSGTTLETLSNETLVRTHFESLGLDSSRHFIAITGKGSPMDDPSRYLESFYIWDWIGGRYSSTSMVGGVMIAFAYGMDVYLDWLRGAHEMDRIALKDSLSENIPLLAALLGIWNHNFLGFPTYGLMPYSQALIRFPAHVQQLDMESNGKRIDKQGRPVSYQTGPIIWGEPGTNSQHSFFQLLHQGKEIVPLVFVGFKESQYGKDLDVKGTTSQEKLLANLFAQSIALATGKNDENPNRFFPGNRPSHLLLAKKLTPFTLGSLLSFFEHKIAFQGFIWNINSFDQEGVQLGKVVANQLIEQFAARNSGENVSPYPLGQAFIEHLEEV